MTRSPKIEIPLHSIFTYTDVDRAFWQEHLENWVPQRLIDAHVHIVDPCFQIETITEEMKRQYWVNELSEMQDAATAARCFGIVFPGREVSCVTFGFPSLGWDIEGANLDLSRQAAQRGWYALGIIRPTWAPEQVEQYLRLPGIIGVKPYYMLLGYDRVTRDRYLEASIFDFLPHPHLEILNHCGSWVTLHVPKAERLGHPGNLREILEIRKKYPRIKLIIAHLGRCYTKPHALEGLLPLAEDPGLYFDNSAVLNSAVHRLALEHIGFQRILYGTDNPIFYMRGRRQWQGRTYLNRTSHPFYFNREREPPEIEATYTLFMYEALKGLKQACQDLNLGPDQVQSIFEGNARRLIQCILLEKGSGSHG